MNMFGLGKRDKRKSSGGNQSSHSRSASMATTATDTTAVQSPTSPISPVPMTPAVEATASEGTADVLPTSGNGPRPFDVVHERFFGWKVMTKQLVLYFEGISEAETHMSKRMAKLSEVAEVPSAARGHFSTGGSHDLYLLIKEKTKSIADDHAALAKSIDVNVVGQLQTLRTEIKGQIKAMEEGAGKLTLQVEKERLASNRLITDLSKHLNVITDGHSHPKGFLDPYVTNIYTAHQLRNQLHLENQLHESLVAQQQHAQTFEEESILKDLRTIFALYDEHTTRAYQSIQTTRTQIIAASVENFVAAQHWDLFVATNPDAKRLISPSAPLRDTLKITYPNMDSEWLKPVKKGLFERKKRYTRTYRESFFVLTPSGFLHEFSKDSSEEEGDSPLFTLYLPECILGGPSSIGEGRSTKHKFFVEGAASSKTNSKGITRSSSIKKTLRVGSGGGSKHAWSLKFRSREDMLAWHEAMMKFSSAVGEDGGVMKAVRGVGYDTHGKTASGASAGAGDHDMSDTDEGEDYASATGGDSTGSDEQSPEPRTPHSARPQGSDSGFAGLGAGKGKGGHLDGPRTSSDEAEAPPPGYKSYGVEQVGYSDDKTLQEKGKMPAHHAQQTSGDEHHVQFAT